MLTTPGGSSAWRQMSAKRSAVSGVVSAGFSTTVLPQASAGAIFQASISSGKFHGMIWPGDAERPRPAVRERVLELVGPARVVEEVRRRERQVDVARLLDRLAAVERLGDGELARALLDQERAIRKRYLARSEPGSDDQPSSNASARRLHREIDVARSRASATSARCSSCRGLDRREPLAASEARPARRR